jgi:hypothetical protein
MPSSSSASSRRTLRFPPPDLDTINIPGRRQSGRNWFRVHQGRHKPIFFSVNTNHRFSHEDSPYRLLYLGLDLDTCLFERFGDETYDGKMTLPESLWKAHSVSLLRCPILRMCDLTNPRTLAALRVEYTALMNEKLRLPQAWGLAIQRHPNNFQGIKYKSRFNGRTCLVIFDRDDIARQISVKSASPPLDQHDSAVDWMAEHKIRLY